MSSITVQDALGREFVFEQEINIEPQPPLDALIAALYSNGEHGFFWFPKGTDGNTIQQLTDESPAPTYNATQSTVSLRPLYADPDQAQYDGADDLMAVANGLPMINGNDWALALWVKHNALGKFQQYLSRGNPSTTSQPDSFQFRVSSANRFQFIVRDGDDVQSVLQQSSITVEQGVWHYAEVNYHHGTKLVSLVTRRAGESEFSTTTTTLDNQLGSNDSVVTLAARNGVGDQNLDGSHQAVLGLDRLLTAGERDQIFAIGPAS